ncbi:MAG: hypothetical protein ACLSTO_10710 [Bilophila wadsworthia]
MSRYSSHGCRPPTFKDRQIACRSRSPFPLLRQSAIHAIRSRMAGLCISVRVRFTEAAHSTELPPAEGLNSAARSALSSSWATLTMRWRLSSSVCRMGTSLKASWQRSMSSSFRKRVPIFGTPGEKTSLSLSRVARIEISRGSMPAWDARPMDSETSIRKGRASSWRPSLSSVFASSWRDRANSRTSWEEARQPTLWRRRLTGSVSSASHRSALPSRRHRALTRSAAPRSCRLGLRGVAELPECVAGSGYPAL